jgi:hypothetical protein
MTIPIRYPLDLSYIVPLSRQHRGQMTATPPPKFICNQYPEGIDMGRQKPDISAAVVPTFAPCRSRGQEKLLLKVHRIHVISTNLIPGMRN